MAQMYELTTQNYEDCYYDECSKNMPSEDFTNILTRSDFQELTIKLFENHDEYCLTEGEVYDINNKYFRWDGQMMVAIPDNEVTEEMIDNKIDFTSADYAIQFEQEYEDETENKKPDFKNVEFLDNWKEWVYKTLKFMKYEPAHGDIIDIACIGYRNQGFYQWNDKTKKIVDLYGGDYGVCHPMFRVGDQSGEFSPDHWTSALGYNEGGIFLSKHHVEDIVRQEMKPSTMYDCSIEIDGIKLYVHSEGKITNDNICKCVISVSGWGNTCEIIQSEDLNAAGKFKFDTNMRIVLNNDRIHLINEKLQPITYSCKIQFGGSLRRVTLKRPDLNPEKIWDCYFMYDNDSQEFSNW